MTTLPSWSSVLTWPWLIPWILLYLHISDQSQELKKIHCCTKAHRGWPHHTAWLAYHPQKNGESERLFLPEFLITVKTNYSCFNHRVVTLVADKLETERFTLIWKTNWIRQPKKQLPSSSYITTVQWQHLWKSYTNALQSCSKEFSCCKCKQVTLSQMFWGLLVYCGCKMNWAAAYWVALTN